MRNEFSRLYTAPRGDNAESEDPGATFGTVQLEFIFIPRLRLLEDGLYLIRKGQKKLWEDIRSVDRCDAGIWLLRTRSLLGSYVYFRGGGSIWIPTLIVRKDHPLTPRRSLWWVWRTKDYGFLMDEIFRHVEKSDVSVYTPGPKHVRIAQTVRLALLLALLVIACLFLLRLLIH